MKWQSTHLNQTNKTKSRISNREWRRFLASLEKESTESGPSSKSRNSLNCSMKSLGRLSIAASVAKSILTITFLALWIALMIALLFTGTSSAAEIPGQDTLNVTQIVSAIYQAEGGRKADYPYGIRTVKCTSVTNCRQVCEKTVLRNINRWLASGGKGDFVDFLAERYSPLDKTNWKRNVKHHLRKGAPVARRGIA